MKRSEIRMFLELRELQSNGAIRGYYQREVKIKVTSESCLHDKACDLDPRQKHEDEAKRIRMFLELRELQSNGAIRRYYQKENKIKT